MTSNGLPDDHPEVDIDWSNWSPPSEGDVRCPCPALNSLANHNFLPHTGKNITKAMAVSALGTALNIDSHIASLFAATAITANPDHNAHSFDLNHLDKHGIIEHDASLSRDDVALGNNSDFSPEIFAETHQAYTVAYQAKHPNATPASDVTVDWQMASHVRYARVLASKANHVKANKPFTYTLKQAIQSYGESALLLNVLGKDGNAPLSWIEIFLRDGRLPYNEGWRRPAEPVTQSKLNHAYIEMIKANEDRREELHMIGVGTFEAMKTIILGLGAGLIKSPTPTS